MLHIPKLQIRTNNRCETVNLNLVLKMDHISAAMYELYENWTFASPAIESSN